MQATGKPKRGGTREKIYEQLTGMIGFWPSFSIPTLHFQTQSHFLEHIVTFSCLFSFTIIVQLVFSLWRIETSLSLCRYLLSPIICMHHVDQSSWLFSISQKFNQIHFLIGL
jgi:hypothetical protein